MRNKIIICVLLGVSTISCNEWLEEKPKSVAAETFYNTEAEAGAAVLAPLNKMRGGFDMSYPGLMETFADYAYGRGSWEANSDYEGLNTQNQTRARDLWHGNYKAVRDCNIAISRLPLATELSEEQKVAYIGELRFIRAISYFYMVRVYAGIPLRTEENLDEFNLPKSSVEDVYTFIINDLLYAIEHAPDKARLAGTPCKDAARSLLAQVYLQLEKYQEAATYAKQVMDNNKYALVPVATSRDFEKIYGANIITSTEDIFSIKSYTNEAGWQYPGFCAHPSAKIDGKLICGGTGWYGIYTTSDNKIIAGWDENDLRKDYNLLLHDIGLGNNTYLLVKFYDFDASGPWAPGNANPLIRYADVLFTYAEAATKAAGAPTAEAIEALNEVHRRAYGYDPKASSEVDLKLSDYKTTDQFMKLLIQEQAYEFFNEAKRWPFLVRLGIAKQQIKEIKGIDVADKHLLFPIPTTEFDYNEALDPSKDQNPGY